MEQVKLDWKLIADLTPNSDNINLRFLVMDMKQPRRVFSKITGKESELVECMIGDSSGKITLVLWNEDVDLLELRNTYELRNGYINLYDECMSLSKGRHGKIAKSDTLIEEINDDNDMSRPFMGRPRRKLKKHSKTGRTFDGAAGREIRKFCGRKSF